MKSRLTLAKSYLAVFGLVAFGCGFMLAAFLASVRSTSLAWAIVVSVEIATALTATVWLGLRTVSLISIGVTENPYTNKNSGSPDAYP